jgi:metallo-beta-lactamase class B
MKFRFWRCDDDRSSFEVSDESQAAEIVPGLWYVGTHRLCAYLLTSEAGPIVIDTCDVGAAHSFFSQIQRAGVDPASVVAVLHTHAHWDHVGNTAKLVDLSQATAIIGAGDAPSLAKRVPVGRMLCPGEVVDFGQTQLTYFHAPGHTIGCGMYLTELGGTRLCFMGDSCGPYIFRDVRWTGDAEAFRASAERMKSVEADVFLPGHPDQILEVSSDGDPRLSRDQWRRYIEARVSAMEQIVAA